MPHGIGCASASSAVQTTRGSNRDIERVAHLKPSAVQQIGKGDILADRFGRQAANRR